MKIEIEIHNLHEIPRVLKEKEFMQSIQKTKEASRKLIEDNCHCPH
jgi:hypothetical protein